MANTPDFDIDYVAKLARLDLSVEEKAQFEPQLGKIIEYFQQLGDVDTDHVEPTAHANPIYDVLREDEPQIVFEQNVAIANAPASQAGQVVVPKVIE